MAYLKEIKADLVVVKDFFPFKDTRLYKSVRASRAEKEGIFPCPECGCQMIFKQFCDLEAYLDVGDHTPGNLKMESPLTSLEENVRRNSQLLTR